jgi:hypothetical protein
MHCLAPQADPPGARVPPPSSAPLSAVSSFVLFLNLGVWCRYPGTVVVQIRVGVADRDRHQLVLASAGPIPPAVECVGSFRVYPSWEAAGEDSAVQAVSVVGATIVKDVQPGASLVFWALASHAAHAPDLIQHNVFEERGKRRCVGLRVSFRGTWGREGSWVLRAPLPAPIWMVGCMYCPGFTVSVDEPLALCVVGS